jgi:hypothetical protein
MPKNLTLMIMPIAISMPSEFSGLSPTMAWRFSARSDGHHW